MSPASFFSISLYFNILAGLSLSSFLPFHRSPPPLLRRESWAGEVSTQEPKLSTSSDSPRRRATIREPQQRGARGGRLALHQRKCGWSSRRAARLQGAPANRSSRLQRLQKLAVSEKGRRDSAVPQAAESSHQRCFCPAGAELARRERPTSRLSAQPPASPRSGFVQDPLGHRTTRSTRAPTGHRALRQPEPTGWTLRPCAGGHEEHGASAGREGSL